MAGVMKSTQPIEELGKSLPWVTEVPEALVRFIGISELLGALGLLLPSLLRIKPNLTPIAALGLTIVMILAFIFHIVKGEYEVLGVFCLTSRKLNLFQNFSIFARLTQKYQNTYGHFR